MVGRSLSQSFDMSGDKVFDVSPRGEIEIKLVWPLHGCGAGLVASLHRIRRRATLRGLGKSGNH